MTSLRKAFRISTRRLANGPLVTTATCSPGWKRLLSPASSAPEPGAVMMITSLRVWKTVRSIDTVSS